MTIKAYDILITFLIIVENIGPQDRTGMTQSTLSLKESHIVFQSIFLAVPIEC